MIAQANIGKKCGERFAGMGLCLLTVVFVILFMGCQNVTRRADTCVLAGKVVDGETEQPIENIQFILCKYDPDTKKYEEDILTSGRDGAFSTTVKPGTNVLTRWRRPLNAGMFLLDYKWLEKTGNLRSQFITVTQDKTDLLLRIKLRPSVKLFGKVKDANGQVVAHASIYLEPRMQSLSTDDSGNFLINAAPADCDFDLLIFPDMATHDLVRVKAGTKQIEVVLQPTCSVKGCAIADDNKPAANLKFWLCPYINSEPFELKKDAIITQDDGTFIAKNLCSGEDYLAYWDIGENADYESGSVKVTLKEGKTITLRVKRDNWRVSGNICTSPETKCARLANYCLDSEDRILACDAQDKVVRVISPEDKLISTWKLDLSPKAIACRDDGMAVVAGDKRGSFIFIAILDKNGKVIRNAKLESPCVTSVAFSGNEIFVSIRQKEGGDYNIYRLDSELANPKIIIEGLRGCCGQLDFKIKDGVIYVAANCEFNVVKYDYDGKEIGRFGKEGQEKGEITDEGFVGCCEPKNICFDTEGNLYTAESVKRRVKKFTPDGKYLGLVGTAEGDYCVRVTIAVSKDCSRIYMLDEGRSIIRLVTLADKLKN